MIAARALAARRPAVERVGRILAFYYALIVHRSIEMKTLLASLFIACALQLPPALAESPASHATAPSSLLGTWAVDITRLPMPPDARPKRVTIEFSDARNGKWTMRVDIVDAGGSETSVAGTYARDGSTVAIQGSIEADVGAMKQPEPNVLVLALGKGGGPASTRIYTVNPDGTHMIETAVNTAANGLPMIRTNYFSRIQ